MVTAPATGTLTRLDAMAVGLAAWRLGAGRARKEDPVQAGARRGDARQAGDTVTEGQPLLTLHTDEPERFDQALDSLDGGYDIEDGASYAPTPLVLDRVAMRLTYRARSRVGAASAWWRLSGRSRRGIPGRGPRPRGPPRRRRLALREHHVEGALLAGRSTV